MRTEKFKSYSELFEWMAKGKDLMEKGILHRHDEDGDYPTVILGYSLEEYRKVINHEDISKIEMIFDGKNIFNQYILHENVFKDDLVETVSSGSTLKEIEGHTYKVVFNLETRIIPFEVER